MKKKLILIFPLGIIPRPLGRSMFFSIPRCLWRGSSFVDDEPDILRFARFSLEKHGYDVLTATNGQEAIELARDKKPDLVLMDIVLKGEMDGIEAAKQIHSYFNIPIIYLTAHTDDEKLARAKVTAPFGYIAKPFEDRELKFAIEIGLYKAETENQLKTLNEKLQASKAGFNNIVAKNVDGKG